MHKYITATMTIEELASRYVRALAAYTAGSSEITDEEYDRLEDELRRRAPFHPCLHGNGGVLLGLKNDRRRTYEEWYAELPGAPLMVLQPKIDGIAIGLRYVDGVLAEAQTKQGCCVLGLTQADVGEVPKRIRTKKSVEIHGELWGLPENNEDKRTPQSLAAASARYGKKYGSELRFNAYRILGSLTDEEQSRQNLQAYGFRVTDQYVCTSTRQVSKLHEQWMQGHCGSKRPFNNKLFRNIPTDGVVAKVFDQRLQRTLGADSETVNWAMALKAQH